MINAKQFTAQSYEPKVSIVNLCLQSSKFSSHYKEDPATQSKYNYLLSELENAKAQIL